MVTISIIIPVYNAEKYLKECFAGILNQTFQNFKIFCLLIPVEWNLNIFEEKLECK